MDAGAGIFFEAMEAAVGFAAFGFAAGSALCLFDTAKRAWQQRAHTDNPSDPLPVGNGDTLGGWPGAPAELFQIEDDGWVTVRPAFAPFHDTLNNSEAQDNNET